MEIGERFETQQYVRVITEDRHKGDKGLIVYIDWFSSLCPYLVLFEDSKETAWYEEQEIEEWK